MSSHQPRVRITISLAKELADKVDETIDGIHIRNRSHAVESLLTETLQVSSIRQAVILAGGEQAVKRLPAIHTILQQLVVAGILDVTVAVGYLGDKIRQDLGDGSNYGLKISYYKTELGTGGALAELKDKLKQTFLVVNLTEPVEADLKGIITFHRQHNPTITLACTHLGELTGIYVIEPKVFMSIPKGFCMLEETVFPELTKQGKLLPYPVLTSSNRS